MSADHITVIALGPGRRGALTVDALEALRAARRLYLRAARVPLPVWLRDELPAGALILDLDELCGPERADAEDAPEDMDIERATRMAEALLDAALEGLVAYGAPGYLPQGDLVVRLLRTGASRRGLGVRVVGGLAGAALDDRAAQQLGDSEPVQWPDGGGDASRLKRHGKVPQQPEGSDEGARQPDDSDEGARHAAALQVIAAAEVTAPGPAIAAAPGLAGRWIAPAHRLLDAQTPLLVEQINGPHGLAEVSRWLLARYPSEHVATLWPGPDGPAAHLALSALVKIAQDQLQADYIAAERAVPDQLPASRQQIEDGIYSLYVPPLAPLADSRAVAALGYITARLRGPGGCPWDREQTHASLTPYMIEEAYEAVDAIERDDIADMIEELGDVLLQVVLHSQLAEEAGRFSLDDVAEEVNRKLVRRHPHVFGDTVARTSSEVLRNWERIKRTEKGERRASALDGIPAALPALSLAQTMGRKAAKLGFDWPDAAGVLAKVGEELAEISAAASADERQDEMGDLLFALTSACRHLGIDAESALRGATHKFAARFRRVESLARERNLDLAALDAARLDDLWQEAKTQP